MKNSYLLIFIFIATISFAENLTPIEKQITDTAKGNTEEAIALLEKVTNINSGTMNQEGVTEVGKIFMKEFEALGFDVRWIPQKEVNRAGHLFAERKGNKGKRVLIIGHLD